MRSDGHTLQFVSRRDCWYLLLKLGHNRELRLNEKAGIVRNLKRLQKTVALMGRGGFNQIDKNTRAPITSEHED